MSKADSFLDQLSSQTSELAGPPKTQEEINESIMRIIDSWRKKGTRAYKSFLERHEEEVHDPGYLGYMFAKAGIPYNEAWDYVKDTLLGYYDNTSDIQVEFDKMYHGTSFDSLWTIRHFTDIK